MLTAERRAEIRRKVVEPYLDLSDLHSESDRRDQGHYHKTKSRVGRLERTPAELARVEEVKRLIDAWRCAILSLVRGRLSLRDLCRCDDRTKMIP